MNSNPGFQRIFLFSLLVLTACAGVSGTPEMPSSETADSLPTTPTPVLSGNGAPETLAETITPDPLRFVLPTQGAEPVSAWRPPLYPTPWALSPYDHFYFARPIAADEVNWPVADYRYGGIFSGSDVVHTGVDIPADAGTPVLAAGPGQVVWAGWGLYSGVSRNSKDPYGLAVAIRHDFGYQNQPLFTVYAHLQEVDVAVGQWLDTGDPLGKVGDTGFTTGPHLHFEVRLGANNYFSTRNPELWLVPPQGWGVLAARIMNSHQSLLYNYAVIVRSQETGRVWIVKSYGPTAVNSDAYYNENLVLSDLPAGHYLVQVPYAAYNNELEIQIFPGQVAFFTFQGYKKFNTDAPPIPTFDLPLTPAP